MTNIKAIEQAAKKIELQIFKKANASIIGGIKSHFKGHGLQFKEHKIYVPGDDTRFIDWKLLARTNTPYIRTFEEDRNVEINIYIDTSPTMFNGGNNILKFQAAVELTCLMYYLAAKSKDKVQTFLTGPLFKHTSRSNGHKGIVELFSLLESNELLNSDGNTRGGKFDLAFDEFELFRNIQRDISKKKHVILFSDFHFLVQKEELKKLISNEYSHFIKLLGPLDSVNRFKFSIFNKKQYNKKNTNTDLKFEGLNFLSLSVVDNYLDNFLKSLMK